MNEFTVTMDWPCDGSCSLWNPYFSTAMTFLTVTPTTTENVSMHGKNNCAWFSDEHYLEPLLAFSTVGTFEFWNPRRGR